MPCKSTNLVLRSGLLSQSHDGGNADSKVVATNEVCLALLDDVPVLLQVVELVAVGSSKVSDQAAVVASDNDTAAASGLLLIDTVADLKASLLGGIREDVGVLVLANAAEVDDGLGREDVLGLSQRTCIFDAIAADKTIDIPGRLLRCSGRHLQQ